MKIYIYFEGDIKLKRGFRAFFQKELGAKRFILINGDSGSETIKDFVLGLHSPPNAKHSLLIDSDVYGDNPVSEVLSIVKKGYGARYKNNYPSDSEAIHLMVQVMESWFLADKEILQEYFGDGFQLSRIPKNEKVEEILKADVMNGLKDATGKSRKGKYHKTKHAPDILERLDPEKVRMHAPYCDRLFRWLTDVQQGS